MEFFNGDFFCRNIQFVGQFSLGSNFDPFTINIFKNTKWIPDTPSLSSMLFQRGWEQHVFVQASGNVIFWEDLCWRSNFPSELKRNTLKRAMVVEVLSKNDTWMLDEAILYLYFPLNVLRRFKPSFRIEKILFFFESCPTISSCPFTRIQNSSFINLSCSASYPFSISVIFSWRNFRKKKKKILLSKISNRWYNGVRTIEISWCSKFPSAVVTNCCFRVGYKFSGSLVLISQVGLDLGRELNVKE